MFADCSVKSTLHGDFSFSSMTGIFVDLPMKKFEVLGETFKNVINSFGGLARKLGLLEAKKKKKKDCREILRKALPKQSLP